MGKSRSKNLCRNTQKCSNRLVADLNRDRRSAITPPEMIHRLRVSCRQGEALLQWCKKRKGEPGRIKKTFRRIRHYAGPLRDADIVVMQLQALSRRQPTRCWWILWGMVVQWHAQLAAAWRDVHETLYRNAQAIKQIANKERVRKTFSLRSEKICLARMQKRYDQWKVAVEKAKRPELLHRLRIAGKRLRYALETYPDARLENKRQWIPWLKILQDALGRWRDQQLLQVWILDAERFSVQDIVKISDWLKFLHSCHKAVSKEIAKNQFKIQKLLQKPPEWVTLR